MKARLRGVMRWVSRDARPFVSLFVTVVVYACCRALFYLLSGNVGLFAPTGSLNLGVAALGVIVLGLRLWVLFVVPVLFAYRLARHVRALIEAGRVRRAL